MITSRISKNHTIILSSHILSEISAVCNRVIIINKGRVVAEDTPEKLSDELGKSKYKLRLKGEAEAVVKAVKEDKAFSMVEETEIVEEGTAEITVCGAEGVDAREAAFDNAVSHGYKLVMVKSEKMSLEDVFLQVTEENFVPEEETEEEVEI